MALALVLKKHFGEHTESILHWPPMNNFEIFVRVEYPLDLDIFCDNVMNVKDFVFAFVFNSYDFLDKHSSELEVTENFFSRIQVSGFPLTHFILDVHCEKTKDTEEIRRNKIHLVDHFGLMGFVFSYYFLDYPVTQDMVSLAYML